MGIVKALAKSAIRHMVVGALTGGMGNGLLVGLDVADAVDVVGTAMDAADATGAVDAYDAYDEYDASVPFFFEVVR